MAIASPPEGPNRVKIWSTNKIDVTAVINTWGLENETRGFMESTKAIAGGFAVTQGEKNRQAKKKEKKKEKNMTLN